MICTVMALRGIAGQGKEKQWHCAVKCGQVKAVYQLIYIFNQEDKQYGKDKYETAY